MKRALFLDRDGVINKDYNYDGIKMTISDENYNFNNLSIIYDENDDRYNPRLEIFYSE